MPTKKASKSSGKKRGAKSASSGTTKNARKKESSLSSLSSQNIISDGWSVAQYLKDPPAADGYVVVFLVNPLESTKQSLRVAWPETCLACGHWFDFPAAAVEAIIPLGVEECCATPFPKAALKIRKQHALLIQMLRAHLAGNLGTEMASTQAPVQARGRGLAVAAVSFEEEMCGSDSEAAAPRALARGGEPGVAEATTLELSGPQWVARFPGSRSIFDTKPPFLDKISKFHQALVESGAQVKISATFRPPERAYLMHFSLKISKGQIDPRKVPPMSGVNIQWFHGDLARSKSAASQMVAGYNIAFPPALTSRHTQGLAIDMTITWAGTINIKDATGKVRAVGAPRTGQTNGTLHSVGASYGVIKLASDPPHWSSDGH